MRMAVMYLAPLVIRVVYFQYRDAGIEEDSRRVHLGNIAEHQANTLDLFIVRLSARSSWCRTVRISAH